MRRIGIGTFLLFAAGTGAAAAPMPDAVAAMIDAAAGDPAQLKIITDIAKKTNPQSIAEIDARLAAITTAQASARAEKLANQGFLQGWSGQGEAGAFLSSGNTSNRGVAVGVNVAKETRAWKHALRGQLDYQQDNGIKTRERYFAGYEGNYKFTPDFYALLTLAYERDIFSGFSRRFAESVGFGYKVINTPALSLALEGGPALRQTAYITGRRDNYFAARGGLNAKWLISNAFTLSQNATLFYDSSNTSVFSLTALTAKVTGALSARLSFQLNQESNPPLGLKELDTTSRVTIVYSF
jgi:putative salt-induced outer membrane protein